MKKIKVLLVEDNYLDAELIKAEVLSLYSGAEFQRVETEEDFLQSIENWDPDLLLSDFRLPKFNGMKALEIAIRKTPRTPFIIVTGTLSEETAADSIKAGAWDYVVKERLFRLRSSIPNMLKLKQEKKQKHITEVALQQAIKRYRILTENTADCIWLANEDYNITFINRSILALTGKSPIALTGESIFSLFYPSYKQKIKKTLINLPYNKESYVSLEAEMKTIDRKKVYVEVIVKRMFQENGTVGFQGSIRDISERKKTQQFLQRLHTAVESAEEAIVITDSNGKVQYVNPFFRKQTGYETEEIIGENMRLVQSGMHSPMFYQKLWDTILTGKTWNGHLKNKRKNGEIYEEEATISPIFDSDGNVSNFVAVKRDVTDKIALEKQYRQAQKMEAIGTLVGGVSHDFNNILTAIYGNAEVANFEIDADSPAKECLHNILESAQKATSIVRQLLTYSRRTSSEKKAHIIQSLVKESIKLIKVSVPSSISLIQDIDQTPYYIDIDETYFHQIILNLITNAVQAIPNRKGIIKISILLEKKVPFDGEKKPYVCLQIEDSGKGIPKAVLSKIFDPFFTTKDPKVGTGLGLSTVLGIVKDANGQMFVDSIEGKGTTFKLYFPKSKKNKEEKNVQLENQFKDGKKQNILIVDDDLGVGNMLTKALKRFSYNVQYYSSSVKALEHYQSNDFDLIILDQVMPHLTGVELAEKIRFMSPDTPIFIYSGYNDLADSDIFKKLNIQEYLMKPLSLQIIMKKISEHLILN